MGGDLSHSSKVYGESTRGHDPGHPMRVVYLLSLQLLRRFVLLFDRCQEEVSLPRSVCKRDF